MPRIINKRKIMPIKKLPNLMPRLSCILRLIFSSTNRPLAIIISEPKSREYTMPSVTTDFWISICLTAKNVHSAINSSTIPTTIIGFETNFDFHLDINWGLLAQSLLLTKVFFLILIMCIMSVAYLLFQYSINESSSFHL